jgi:ribosomal protein S18 acetylase RimI-like enzyme
LVGGALRKIATKARLLRPVPIESIILEPADRYAVLLTLGTRPDCRGHGVGEALTRAFGQRCRELGFDAAYLMTRCDNVAANRLYAKMGWRQVAVREGFNHYRLEVPHR